MAKPQKVVANRVIGMDCSTQSLAYAIIENDVPVTCGEVFLQGNDVYERLNAARQETQKLVDAGILVGDLVAIEKAVFVSNKDVVIKLAYVFGAILSVLMQNHMSVVNIVPIQWQTGINVPNLKRHEKEQIIIDNPGRSKTWLQNEGRRIRKARILDIADQHFSIPSRSDNIGDSCGLALYANEHLTRRA